MTKQRYLSTRQAADILEVSISTVQKLVEEGALYAWKTAGGHRRIHPESVTQFQRKQKQDISGPAALSAVEEKSLSNNAKLDLLVIEDDPFMVQVYSKALERYADDIEVTICQDGLAGLLRIGARKPDLLMLDLNVPNVDGFEMIRSIREGTETRDIQILIVSGLNTSELEPHEQLLKPYKVIRKPISSDFLAGYLACFVAKRKLFS